METLITVIASGPVTVEVSNKFLPKDWPEGTKALEGGHVWIVVKRVGEHQEITTFQVGNLASDSPVKNVKLGRTYQVVYDRETRTTYIDRFKGVKYPGAQVGWKFNSPDLSYGLG